MAITKRGYKFLSDCTMIYNFLNENYMHDRRRGVPGPFFEYAQCFPDFAVKSAYRIGIWEDNGKIVALVAFEVKPGEAYMALSDGYEFLIKDMIDHAEKYIHTESKANFFMISTQTALRKCLLERGYQIVAKWPNKCYDYAKGPLDFKLPAEYRFITTNDPEFDPIKLQLCCWKGFNHESEGVMIPDIDSIQCGMAGPHYGHGLARIVVAPDGEYVCYGGMWCVPEIHMAYLEPLCTVPQYRKKGLAAAVLSEHYRNTKELGANHMTGGGDEFYSRIGFEPWFEEEIWSKGYINEN